MKTKDRNKIIILLISVILFTLFLSISVVTSINWNAPSKDVVFHPSSSNAYFYTNQSLTLSLISVSSTVFTVNTTGFNVSSNNRVNITIMDLDDNPGVGDTALSFYANCSGGTVWFNLSGYTNNDRYNISRDNVFVETVTVSGDLLSFSSSTWSSHLFDVSVDTIISAPTVVTNSSTGVEETNATLHGYLEDDGGEINNVWFEFGLNTDYGNNTYKQSLETDTEYFVEVPIPYYNLSAGDDGRGSFNPLTAASIMQTFTPPEDIYVSNFSAYLRYHAGNTDDYNFMMKIGVGDYPPSSYLADSSIYNSLDLTDDYEWYTFNYSTPILLEAGIEYSFVPAKAPPYSYVTDSIWWNRSDDNPFPYGERWSLYTEYPNSDLIFQINGNNSLQLDVGTLYHYRAVANNSLNISYGNDMAFLTKPNVTVSSTIEQVTASSLNISWTSGDGANNTYVERNSSGVTSWSRGSGIEIYNDSGSYFVDSGLANETTYYYQLWSFTNWTYNPTIFQWSDTYNSTSIFVIGDPIVTTNASTNVEETSAILHGYLNDDGGESCTVWFEYGTTIAYGDISFDLESVNFTLIDTQDDGVGYNNVWRNDSYVYVTFSAASSGIHAYSFNGTSFTLLDTQDDGGAYNDVWANDTYVYVAGGSSGIRAYSFNGTDFTLIDTQDDGTGSYNSIWSDGTYIYTTCTSDGIRAYSFNGASFTLNDTQDDGGIYTGVWGDSTYIYTTSFSEGIRAYTFDGTTFTLVDTQDDGNEYSGVWGDGTYIYVACTTEGIRAYSFNGVSFTLLDTQDDGWEYLSVFVNGTYIYASCDTSGIRAYTFDGTSFTLLDTQADGGSYSGSWANDTYVYVACFNDGIRAYSSIPRKETGETFTTNIIDLQAGTLYHYRAVANNSISTRYGADLAFLTKPNATTNFNVAAGYSPDALNLSWTKGDGANNTYIERNTTSTWNRGEGTLVYNDTGNYYNDSGFPMNTIYYYQAWSYANWTYNPTIYQWSDSYASDSNTTDNVYPPYDGSFTYDASSLTLNITWERGNNSDREIVVQNNVSFPTNPTDGWIRQNSTNQWFNTSTTSTGYFTIWSYNDTSQYYSLTGLDIPWGAIEINVWDENQPWIPVTNYDLLITNEDGSETYYATGLSNPVTISFEDIPFGVNTIVQISHDDFETRYTYVDLYLNTYNNFTFYLTPKEIPVPPDDPDGGDDCVIRSFMDSLSITSFTEDLLINFTHTLEDLIQVEVYNSSLFGTYGGWIVVANDFIDYNTTRVIINKSILDVNSSMARVSYYYESCDPTFFPSGLYYIRIVESYVTSFGITDLSVEDAKVTFQKYMNTTDRYENISTLFTDTNGFVNLYLIPGSLYRVVIEKESYETKTVSYQPAPPNEFGQTTEQVFRIERIDVETEPELTIPNETVVVVPYNTTAFEIYYVNLNNNNLYVNFSIYDGGTLIFTYNESVDPDEIFLYFNFSSYSLNNDILTLVVNATKVDGSFNIHIRYFSISQARRMGPPTLAPIAAVLSICLCMFGLTLAHPKKIFGPFGIIVLIIAIAVTAFTPQVWYLHLIQAIELILLIFVIFVFKEEGMHAI